MKENVETQEKELKQEAEKETATQSEQIDETQQEDNSENELSKLEQELAEWKDKNARLYADFDNLRKRTAKEKLELIRTASEGVILSLLPVIDDFERALTVELKGAAAASTAASLKIDPEEAKETAFEGVALIYSKLLKILEREGVTPIEVMDKPFDEYWSEAVAQIPTPADKTKGNVLDIVLKGYKIDEKVIRHAKVVVGI